MATHIVWGGNNHTVLLVVSNIPSTPSIVSESIDPIVRHKPTTTVTSAVQGALPSSLRVSVPVLYWLDLVGMSHRHQPAPTLGLVELMIRSYDITNTSSTMEMLPFW